ncbi:MAG: MarC family protein [Chitinivibrionales bacterium]
MFFPVNIYTAAVTLLLIMDPFGNIPAYLAIIGTVEEKRRKWVILREMFIALGVLTLFLFFGRYILGGMNISEPALSIAGGVLLFIIALRMIFPREQDQLKPDLQQEPLIVPLAVPLIAGPSSIAVVTLFATQSPDRLWLWFVALLVSWGISTLILEAAEYLRRFVGERLISAIERLMGMILTTLAVQMSLTGIRAFVLSILR